MMSAGSLLKVTTVMAPPFTMEEGNSYKGFIVDLLEKLSESVGFTYTLSEAVDGSYGRQLPDGTWTGMIGELVRGESDIAAAPLTITSRRERVVDFLKPFMSQTVRLLTNKPAIAEKGYDLVLQPFSTSLWFAVLIAVVVVGILLILINRFNPYEWGTVSGDKDPRGAKHSFGLRGSFMFVISTLTLQGFRETPRSLSGRTLAVTWFIFSFFVCVAYIANLFSFVMASEQMPSPHFSSLTDILEGNRIKVLAIRNGNTFQTFKESKVREYQRFAKYIEDDNSFVNTTKEGIDMIQRNRDQYAMLVESSTGEYITNRRPCNLMLAGESFFQQGLSLAVSIDSPFKDSLNLALLKLREDGTLHMLEKKWFVEKGECSAPPTSSPKTYRHVAYQLTTSRLGGVFLILIVGIVLSVLVTGAEILFKRRRS